MFYLLILCKKNTVEVGYSEGFKGKIIIWIIDKHYFYSFCYDREA